MHYYHGFIKCEKYEPLPRFFLLKWYIFDWFKLFRIKHVLKYVIRCVDWNEFDKHKLRVKSLTKVDTEISNFKIQDVTEENLSVKLS